MSHTPEPWHQCDDGNCGCGQILGPESVYIATIKDKQNRERIVACVNACAGMGNDELKGGLLLAVMNKHIERLENERNEYLNAILGMSAMLKNREWANLLSTNDAISDLDVQITRLTDEYNQERRDSLDCSDIEKLKSALSWMGVSTPSSIEECGAKQKHLIRDLITAVLRHKQLKTEGSE